MLFIETLNAFCWFLVFGGEGIFFIENSNALVQSIYIQYWLFLYD